MGEYDAIVNEAVEEIQFANPENAGTDGIVGVGARLGSRSQIDRDNDGVDDYVELAFLNRFGMKNWGSIPGQTYAGPPEEEPNRPAVIADGASVHWIDANDDNVDDRQQQGTDFSAVDFPLSDAAKSGLPGWLRSQLFPSSSGSSGGSESSSGGGLGSGSSSESSAASSGLSTKQMAAGAAIAVAAAAYIYQQS